ncbi:hypothetical protein SASPL_128816 [Salvia splendens]|uniref:Uncharacterized protein n=1 Tax=Salvia splendens TaxID=180675 RepID=A0A8X8XEW0_SALSN|nr:hypothetical protein SASPL_128816 [Salvia splendens]
MGRKRNANSLALSSNVRAEFTYGHLSASSAMLSHLSAAAPSSGEVHNLGEGKEYRWGDVTLKLGEDKGFCKRATLGEMGVKIIPGRNDTIWLGKATQKSVEIVDTTCPWVA